MTDASAIPRLADAARAARAGSHSPYAKFHVGAALLPDNGVIVPGANVENASHGLTCCAERVAMSAARTQHAQASIIAPAVSCGADGFVHAGDQTRMPCGACRQVMVEFMVPDAPIWIDGVGAHKLSDLLATPFKLTRMLS
jgi:cytidine deaminase